jgi:hypothetical protein
MISRPVALHKPTKAFTSHPNCRKEAIEKGRFDPDMAVNIEHEDVELGPFEGLEVAAEVLTAAAADV